MMKAHQITWLIVAFVLFFVPRPVSAQTATITWNTTYQTIDGFGAGDAFCPNESGYDACNLTDAQADLFFSPTNGVGLSILRVQVPNDGSCLTTCDTTGLVTMTKAVARGARLMASPWSPPASMKSNGTLYCNNGSGSLLPGAYASYATYLKNYVQQFASNGAPIYALSIQNEPDSCGGGTTYEATWSGANLHDFVLNNLGPTFSGAGLTTKITLPETVTTTTYGELSSHADATMSDPAAAAYVGIVATHDYSYTPAPYTTGGKPLWMSEVSDLNALDPSMTSALTYAGLIHTWLTAENAQAWNYWWLVNGNQDNEGLVSGGTITKRLYMMGNWAKFVRPGNVRIQATANPAPGVYVSAFKDPVSGQFAIVAINQNESSTAVTFNLTGVTAASVTPWVTSASSNLVQQSSVPVVAGSFSSVLQALSVTTMAGTAASGPTPPTITGEVVK